MLNLVVREIDGRLWNVKNLS